MNPNDSNPRYKANIILGQEGKPQDITGSEKPPPYRDNGKRNELSSTAESPDPGSEGSPFLSKEKEVEIEVETRGIPSHGESDDEFWTDDEAEGDADDTSADGNVTLASRGIMSFQKLVIKGYTKLLEITRGYLIKGIFFIGFLVYFVFAMAYRFGDEGSHRLLVCTLLGLIIIFWDLITSCCRWIFRKLYGSDKLTPSHKQKLTTLRFFIRWLLYGGLAAVVIWTLVDQGIEKPGNLRSLPGLFLFVAIPLLFSTNPDKINWHTIYWAMGTQFLLALFVLKVPEGKDVVLWCQARLDEFFANTVAGAKFIFGETYTDHYMIFGAFPIIFFTNATLTVLYYLGAMQFIIRVVGSILNFILDTSPVESMAVAAGIFMEGVTAILSLRPYLAKLSKSQMFLVVTSVFSSLGGAYLAILSRMGVSLTYLIPSMVVSAPATFAVCKVMVPETKWTKEKDRGRQTTEMDDTEVKRYSGILDAAQTGAITMLSVVGNILVIAFAFTSYIEWINQTLTWFGDRVGIDSLTFELIASYLLYPVALMMGIEPTDCRAVAMLLGYRIGTNNMIAFFELQKLKANKFAYMDYMMKTNFTGPVSYGRDNVHLDAINVTLVRGFISDRSEAIVTYSLCGFSSLLAVFITMGIMTALVPRRKTWFATMAFPAMIAGNIANCMTGCFASIFY